MENLYRQSIELLGRAQEDPFFERVIETIGEKPTIDSRTNLTFFDFNSTGMKIIAHSMEPGGIKLFSYVLFVIDIPSVRDGELKRYSGEIIPGVFPEDTLEQVKAKIALKPFEPFDEDGRILQYDFPGHQARFSFNGPSGEKMALASIRFKTETED
jgi:hypothetical protein